MCVQILRLWLCGLSSRSQVVQCIITNGSDSVTAVTVEQQEVSRPGRAGGGTSGAGSSFPESPVIPINLLFL